MSFAMFGVHHVRHGVTAVGDAALALPRALRQLPVNGARGWLALATCNRTELYLDLDEPLPPQCAAGIVRALGACDQRADTDAVAHLFRVAAGLDAMVVGEREVAGQVRRAAQAARLAGTLSDALGRTVDAALRTSRRVAAVPGLESAGRSLVAVALARAGAGPGQRALLIGTGGYAGATVAALAAAGIRDVAVVSATGRAEAFAAAHPGVTAAATVDAELDRDLVVSCRGGGTPTLTPELLGGRRPTILDLAVPRDVPASVAALPGIRVIDVASLAGAATAAADAVATAERLVAAGVAELDSATRERRAAAAVVDLAARVDAMVEAEIARLPGHRPLTHEDATHALRRLAARMLHEPRAGARAAAARGRTAEFARALDTVFGPESPTDQRREAM